MPLGLSLMRAEVAVLLLPGCRAEAAAARSTKHKQRQASWANVKLRFQRIAPSKRLRQPSLAMQATEALDPMGSEIETGSSSMPAVHKAIHNDGVGAVDRSNSLEDRGWLSQRAMDTATEFGESRYYRGMSPCWYRPYKEKTGTDGWVNFAVSENALMKDVLDERLQLTRPLVRGMDHSGYGAPQGRPEFLQAMASVMCRALGLPSSDAINPAKITAGSGITGLLDVVAFCLADEGDALIIPAPYYPAFETDFGYRANVCRIPAHRSAANGYRLRRESLEEAWAEAQRRGVRVRAVVLTNPENPLGIILSAQEVKDLIAWCEEKDIHLISDEVYAGCVIVDTIERATNTVVNYSNNDKISNKPFTSVLELAPDNPRVHVLYGLSKDFGLSGFRVGLFYTNNSTVLQAVILAHCLGDEQFVNSFLIENRRRLQARYDVVLSHLRAMGVESVPLEGGLYAWVDLRSWLRFMTQDGKPVDPQEAEWQLFERLAAPPYKTCMTPGAAAFSNEPGWFRLCFAGASEETLLTGLERLQSFLSDIKQGNM
eukprot:jgi/Chlat1/6894/Chrsp52S06632